MNGITLKNNSRTLTRTIAMMLCCVLFASICILGTADVAYCTAADAAGQLEDAATDVVNIIYSTMRKIIAPLTCVLFAFAGYQFAFGGSQGTEKARKSLFGAVGGLVLVIFAPVLVQAIATAFTGVGTGDLSQYNPL